MPLRPINDHRLLLFVVDVGSVGVLGRGVSIRIEVAEPLPHRQRLVNQCRQFYFVEKRILVLNKPFKEG
jgi:hypothetical protein